MDPNVEVKTIMTKNLITVKLNDTLEVINRLFNENKIHHLPVVSNGERLVGIISKDDLLRLAAVVTKFSEKEFTNITAADIMTRNVVKLESEDTIGLAADLVMSNDFHALPIVSQDKIIGIITTHDIIKYAFNSPIEINGNREEIDMMS